MYFPGAVFVEVGASFITCEITHENLLEVSADGMICYINDQSKEILEVLSKVEIKCPYPDPDNNFKLPIYYDVPRCYALQLIVEMEAEPRCNSLIFACYTKDSTVISRVKFDNELWLLVKIEIKCLLQKIKENKIPTQRSLIARDSLPTKIKEFLDSCVEILIEVPSVEDLDNGMDNPTNNDQSPYLFPKMKDGLVVAKNVFHLESCVNNMRNAFQIGYELSRLKAKELYVALLSSTDRNYDPERPLFYPVFYGLKGSTFSKRERRLVYDTIMDAWYRCHSISI